MIAQIFDKINQNFYLIIWIIINLFKYLNNNYLKNLNTIEMQLSNNVIGLTKEQLEQYRSDPFWKTLR